MTLSINSQNPIRMPVSPLQMLLLIQLDEGPKYGYEMLKTLKDEFEGTWEPKTGTVYPALKSLEKKGYITTETHDDTDYYQITKKGQTLFELMQNHLETSIDFSVKYISVVYKWLSNERKQGAMELLERLAAKEHDMSSNLLESFTETTDTATDYALLEKMRNITKHRLEKIDKLLENKQ
jgi:DNA-binding PadR family transcriptional regulator